MKYALLVYDIHAFWQDLPTGQKRALHGDYRALSNFPGVIGLYRLQPPKTATTVRFEEDQLVKTEGPRADASQSLRAFYLLESDDHDSVLELAAGIPAARTGGAVEVWPLTELRRHDP